MDVIGTVFGEPNENGRNILVEFNNEEIINPKIQTTVKPTVRKEYDLSLDSSLDPSMNSFMDPSMNSSKKLYTNE